MADPKRNFNEESYRKWRHQVKKRDNYKCQIPGCESTTRLQVHHIKTWAKHPGLRYDIANGITLCAKCHKSMKGKEESFEHLCKKILEWNLMEKLDLHDRLRKIRDRKREENGD